MTPLKQDPIVSLDLTGLKCPLPVLKARRQVVAMRKTGETGVVEVHADDPAAPLDFDHFCATQGLTLLRSDQQGSAFVFHILVSAEDTGAPGD